MLARLARHYHIRLALDDPRYIAAIAKLQADSRHRREAGFTLAGVQRRKGRGLLPDATRQIVDRAREHRQVYSKVVTAVEAFELTSQGGATDFARLILACESFGPYCLIGGLAVNCYVEPVYTLDADLVTIAANLPKLAAYLRERGFKTEDHPHSMNVMAPGSELRIQFTTDERYQAFLARAVDAKVLGCPVRIASLEDVTQGKLWAYSDPQRRLSKRKKDELDLVRLAEAYPELKSLYPEALKEQIDRG